MGYGVIDKKPEKKLLAEAYVAFALWTVGCAIVPMWMILSTNVRMSGPHLILAVTLTIYAGTHLCALIGGRTIRPLAGTFWLFAYVSMGIAPLAQVTTGMHQILITEEFQAQASMLVLACFVAYDLGQLVAKQPERQKSTGTSQPSAAKLPRELRTGRLLLASWLTLAATAYFVNSAGSLAVFFSSREERKELSGGLSDDGGQAFSALFAAMGTVPQLVVLICWTTILGKKENRRELSNWVWWLLFLGVNTIVNNPISNSRYWFLTVAISFLFALPTLTVFRYRSALTLGTVAALVAFPISDVFRNAQSSVRSYGTVLETIATKDYDQMVMINNGMWWVSEQGHTWGYQMLGNLFFWVPRSVWPSKPIDTGVAIGTHMQVSNVNLSSPLWIEIWADFSWVGAALVFLLLGWASFRVDQKFSAFLRTTELGISLTSLLVPLLAGYQFIILRGPLLQSMGRLAVMLVLLYLLFPRTTHEPKARSHRGYAGRRTKGIDPLTLKPLESAAKWAKYIPLPGAQVLARAPESRTWPRP